MSSPDDTLSVDGLDSARRVPRLEAGAHIGRYVILELLGEGGMGAVYSAFDPSLNRRVALKLLGIVAQDSNAKEQAHARLQREAQALAQVRHPSVATVHDVGATPDGEFYIAMQFVEGEDLRHYCKDRPWREIVEVYTRAASGLAACHREGLVHRDFKPSNVMVEENGRPVILDFGLARAIEESSGESDPGPLPEEMAERVRQAHKTLGLSTSSNTLLSSHLTVNGALMGTPAYMSPEQLHGAPLGAQTDQYSFCAAMYEALYGVRPAPGDFQSAPGRDNQRHNEPPKESTVPRWYHRVLARGLDRDPEHRWDSMDELATQLRRDPSRAVRTRAMGVAALLAVVLIVLGVVNYRRSLANECREKGGRISEIWNGKRAIELGERFLAIPLPYAAGTWDRTKTLLNEYAAEWRSRRTEMCLARTLEGSLSTETAMRANACFDESATALRSLADQWSQPDEKHVQTALSAVFSLPPLDNCQDEVELSRRLERAKENTASTQLRIRLAESNALRHTGRYDESVKVAEHVLEQANTHPSLSVAAKLAIGRAKDRLWDNEGARSALKEAYLGADSEGLDTLALDAAIALIRVVGSKLSDARESAVWEGIAKARIHRMKLGPEHVYRATLLDAIGRLREHQGLYEESQRILAQAIEIRSASLGESTPENVRTMNNLGIAYYRNGRYEDAAKWIDRARRIARDAFGPGHPSYANSLSALSVALNRLGRTDEALKLARRALTIQTQALGPNALAVGTINNNIGRMFHSLERYDDALERMEEAIRIYRRVHGDTHPQLGHPLYDSGRVYETLNDYQRAAQNYVEAYKQRQRGLGEEHPLTALALAASGRMQLALGQNEEAESSLTSALKVQRKVGAPAGELANTLFSLAQVYWAQPERRRDAVALAEEAKRELLDDSASASNDTLAQVRAWVATRR